MYKRQIERRSDSWRYVRQVPVTIDGREVNVTFYLFYRRAGWNYIAVFPRNPRLLLGHRVAIDLARVIEAVTEAYPQVRFEGKWLFGVGLGAEVAEGPCEFVLRVGEFSVRPSLGRLGAS